MLWSDKFGCHVIDTAWIQNLIVRICAVLLVRPNTAVSPSPKNGQAKNNSRYPTRDRCDVLSPRYKPW